MGTIQRRATISGKTLQEAFQKLQAGDKAEKGDDIYSGGWNNCCGIREVSPEKFDRRDDINKHEGAIAKCIKKPIGNKNKIKTVVTNFPVKGARKWETKYEATSDTKGWDTIIVSETKQAEAIKKVRDYVGKHPDETIDLHIVKVLKDVDSKVATINYKKSSAERYGVWEIFGAMSY